MTLKRNPKIVNSKFTEYFIPTVLTAMANNIAVLVDSVIVGQMVGSTSMAAINLLSPVTQLYFSLTILFGLGASSLISFAKGKNDKKEAEAVFTVMSTAVVILAVLLMVVQLLFLNQIASFLTDIPSLKEQLVLYYVPYIIGTPIQLMLLVMVHCIRSDARPTFASNLIIISNAINLTMDIVLMHEKLFNMGIMGSSIATVIGNTVAIVIMLSHFKNPKNTLKFDFSIFKTHKKHLKILCNLLATGISGALGTLLVMVRMYYLNTLIQSHSGADGMVAMSVVSMTQIFISAFITGASQTMIPIVSVLLGEKDKEGIRYVFKRAVKVLVVSAVFIVIVIEIFPSFVANMFGTTLNQLPYVVTALRISCLSFVGLALSFLIMYYFMAVKQKVMSITISIVNGVVITVLSAMVLSRLFGINGVWMSLNIAQYGTLLVIAVMLFVKIKTSKGMYTDFYLIKTDDTKEILSISIDRTTGMDSINACVDMCECDNKALLKEKLEEIINQINLVGSRKNKPILTDIRVVKENEQLKAKIRSTCAQLDKDKLKEKGYEIAQVLNLNQISFKV